MTLSGFQLHQKIYDLDGKPVSRELPFTEEQIVEANKTGIRPIADKTDLTIGFALSNILRADLSQRSVQGTVPDPHEAKKYEMYALARKILKVPNDDSTIVIEAEDVTIIKERAKKWYTTDTFGFIYEVLEGINTEFKTVKPPEAE